MDNFRIEIENINKSQSLTIDDTTYSGFTIVTASKGPRKPYYVPAGKYSVLSEVFGYPSKDHQGLQEVYDLNGAYGLWVSAPYEPTGSKIPVAYTTPTGVFARHTPITLASGQYVEDIEEEEIQVEGISLLASSDPDILIPVGQETNLFTESSTIISDVLSYNITDNLTLDLSFDIKNEYAITTLADTKYHFLSTTVPSVTGPQVMKNTSGDLGVLTFIIPGKDPLDVSVEYSGGNFVLRASEDLSGIVIGEGTGTEITTLSIFGAAGLPDAYASYFDENSMASRWADVDFIKSVKVYWKASLVKEAVTSAIYPKFLSSRDTVVSFATDDYNNSFRNTVSENISDAKATYTFKWSLDSEAVDGFGNSLEASNQVDNETLINIHVFKTFNGFSFTKTGGEIGPKDFSIPGIVSRAYLVLAMIAG